MSQNTLPLSHAGHPLTLNNINSLPNDKFLDWSKLKAFADDKINVTEKPKFVLERVENIMGKEENMVTSNLTFSHIFFKSPLPQGH